MLYFNEIDPYATDWLHNLFPDATIDRRSIVDVLPTDLVSDVRRHFFAGIGGWELALQLAGWPEDREVWTGSCPCQPFSVAGRRKGREDARHLWPDFFYLIAQCRPAIVFGEQTGKAPGREWLAGVRTDLEAIGYAVGAADLCAPGVGAPHLRERLYWVAVANWERRQGHVEAARRSDALGMADGGCHADERRCGRGQTFGLGCGAEGKGHKWQRRWLTSGDSGDALRLGESSRTRLEERGREPGNHERERTTAERAGGESGGMDDPAETRLARNRKRRKTLSPPDEARLQESSGRNPPLWMADASRLEFRPIGSTGSGQFVLPGWSSARGSADERAESMHSGAAFRYWDDFDITLCQDQKARRIEPSSLCLVDGIPFALADGRTQPQASRSSLLRGFGNAVVAPLAAVFIRAVMEAFYRGNP